MSVTQFLQARGLWTSPSPLSAPLGSYAEADNCVVNNPDVVESRRGYEYVPYFFGTEDTQGAGALFSYRGVLFVQFGDLLAYDTGITFQDIPGAGFTPPDVGVLRMQAQEASNNLYVTTLSGVKVIDTAAPASSLVSGVPLGAPPQTRSRLTRLYGEPDSGWLLPNYQTAYVLTWLRTDANDTPHEGVPSNAIYVTNPADITAFTMAKAVSSDVVEVTTTDPHGLNVGDRIQVTYGTPTVDFPDGVKTVSALGRISDGGDTSHVFQFVDSVVNAGPGTVGPAGTIASDSKNVQVAFSIPPDIDATFTARIYRAKATTPVTVFPRSQYYLTKEHQLTAGDIATGGVVLIDYTTDKLLQDALYTNTDDGEPPDSSVQNDNSRPPLATDICLFDERLWGANYQEYATFPFALLGVGAPNGLQVGDTITIDSITYTAVAESAAVLADTTFRVFLSSDSPTVNVTNTAESLALAVTKTVFSNCDCYYTSGVEDIPGQLLARRRILNAGLFTIYVSRVSAWGPEMTTTSVDALSASVNAATNGLWYSKQNQPEAVPLLNRQPIGPTNCRILRIRPLRDKLFVFTDIAGIWTVNNTYPYNVYPVSQTAVLLAPDSLVNFDDDLYCLSTQGVTRVNASGPAILSIPIEQDIKRLFGTGLARLKTLAFGIGYESYRKYILSMPTEPTDTYNTQSFVYDVATKTWTRWTKPISAGVVVPQTDFLYIGSRLVNKISKERKNFDRTDYADESFTLNIVSSSDTSVTVDTTVGVTAGDLLYVDPILQATVVSVTSATVLEIHETVPWAAGTATVFTGIANRLVYSPVFSGGPEQLKHYREVNYHFRRPAFSLGQATFSSDLNPQENTKTLALGGWGDPEWEGFAWSQPALIRNKRVIATTGSQRVAYLSAGFSLREAQSQWQLLGVTPVYEAMSERSTK